LVVATLVLSGCRLQPRFDARRSGHVPGDQALSSGNAHDLAEVWRVTDLGGPVNDPIALGGTVYVTTRTGGVVAAFRTATGAQRFREQFSPPAGLEGRTTRLTAPVWHDNAVKVGLFWPSPPTFLPPEGEIVTLDGS